MKTLSLAYPERSEIGFKVSKYPDGQQDLTITEFPAETSQEWGIGTKIETPVRIESRFNSLEDLGLILCATKALRRLGAESITLFIPYLFSARADRLFKEGGVSYLVDVIAPILNAQEYKHVIVYDPHSDVAAACINNLVAEDNNRLLRFALNDLYGPNCPDNFVLVSPDGGSLKKIYKASEKIGFTGEVVVCSKSRDLEGKLSKIVVPFKPFQDKDYIIIDDICDGGRTFLNIAQEIKPYMGKKARIILVISHGIFSAGFKELSEYFDSIYCTNAVRDLSTFEFGAGLKDDLVVSLVKQLNIFKQ